MGQNVMCHVEFPSDGAGCVSLVVQAPALATALRVSDRCPFVLCVDSSLLFCTLSAPGSGGARPTFVFVFGNQVRADVRGSAARMLDSEVEVLFVDADGQVPAVRWTVLPRSGSDRSRWRDELLADLGFL